MNSLYLTDHLVRFNYYATTVEQRSWSRRLYRHFRLNGVSRSVARAFLSGLLYGKEALL